MRKSTVVMLAIVIALFIALTWAAKFFADQFAEEIAHAKDLTAEFRDRQHLLAPETTVRLARVMGSSKTIVTDPDSPGLLLEAQPSSEAWKRDLHGEGIAERMAAQLFVDYRPERPIQWIQFRLRKPDGTLAPEFALGRGDRDEIVPLGVAPAPGGAVPDSKPTDEKKPDAKAPDGKTPDRKTPDGKPPGDGR